MGILSRLFGRKEKTANTSRTPTDNPALSYVQDKYGLDAGTYIKVARMVHAHAEAAAREFAETLGRQHTPHSVHFFFDFFCAFYFMIARPNTLPKDKDASSAIIDGMHLEYFGDVSGQVVQGLVAAWATDDPCLLRTFLAALPRQDRYSVVVPLAVRAIDPSIQVGASEVIGLTPRFQEIQNAKLSSIDVFASAMLG